MLANAYQPPKKGNGKSKLPQRLLHYLDERNFPALEIYNKLMGRVPHYAMLLSVELKQVKNDANASQMLGILQKNDGKPDAHEAANLLYFAGFLPDDGRGPCSRAKMLADALDFLLAMAEAAREKKVELFALKRAELEGQKTPKVKVFERDFAVLFAQ